MKKKEKSGIIKSPDILKKNKVQVKLCDEDLRFRALVEQSPDIICLVDRNGIITYENKAVEKVLGYRRQDRIGASSFDHVHSEKRQSMKRGFNKLFKDINAPAFQSEVRIRHKDGTWRIFEIICSVLSGNNTAKSVTVNLRDITERKEVEEKLRKSEANYRQLFDNAPAGIYQIDFKNRKFLNANDVFCKYAGCSQEEIASLNVFDILDEESKKHYLQRRDEVALGIEVPDTVEYGIINKKGERFYVLLHLKNIYDDEGNVIAADIIAHDITERKKAEEELKHFAENLEDANIALRVLMNSRDKDQKEFDGKLQVNINDLVIPYLKKLKAENLDNRNKNYVSILEKNLGDVLSPFMRDIRSAHKNLTPQEIQIVDLIRHGKNTKEIANMLNTSVNTIATHRNNIRKKLNLRNSKINLRSHILSSK
jgi:PAS domain S-box-containing protein